MIINFEIFLSRKWWTFTNETQQIDIKVYKAIKKSIVAWSCGTVSIMQHDKFYFDNEFWTFFLFSFFWTGNDEHPAKIEKMKPNN